MYDNLIEMINKGQYENVVIELEKHDISEYTEDLSIIAASTFLALGDYAKAQRYLQLGLQINCKSDELYLLLGNYFERYNLIQALLCYENAELYCQDIKDKEIIWTFKNRIEEENGIKSRKISIILSSVWSLDITKRCIESIRKNSIPASYEIIIIDNALPDELMEWLKNQKDVNLIEKSNNLGEAYGYNQGIKAADKDSDIMLLDSNTVLLPNALFWLRMGLYEEENIGAVGSQKSEKIIEKGNILIRNSCESQLYLDKFAILIRREVINAVGVLDSRFEQGKLWDKDFGLRLCLAGWENRLCHNSLIYRCKNNENQIISKDEKEKFIEKWSFDVIYDQDIGDKIIGLINRIENESFHVLEIGCRLGETLAKIKFKYINSEVYGIEFSPEMIRINSRLFNVVQGDIQEFYVPFGNVKFDYIVLQDVLGDFINPEEVIQKLSRRLKVDGAILCSVPNHMNISLLYNLLNGDLKYEECGILDKAHLNIFDLNSIHELYGKRGIYIDKLEYIKNKIDGRKYEERFLENICDIFKNIDKKQFLSHHYVFRAKFIKKKCQFKITAIGMVKNAADVIETYIRSNGQLIDNFVLLDNMCSDRTISILEQLQQEGFEIEIIKDEEIGYKQSEKMNRLIYYVNEKYRSDFIIPIDDDECIIPSSEKNTIEDVRNMIEQLPQNNLYYLRWKIYVPNEEDNKEEICVIRRQEYCYKGAERVWNKIIIPRGVLMDGTFLIAMGNHEGSGKLIENHVTLPFVCMAHFPCRSELQVRSKVLTGWTNYLTLPERKDGDGYQWEIMYSIAKKGNKLSIQDMQQMALLYIMYSEREKVYICKEPVNLPEEAMIIKYTQKEEVNPWENYCANVEVLAKKYVELLNQKVGIENKLLGLSS